MEQQTCFSYFRTNKWWVRYREQLTCCRNVFAHHSSGIKFVLSCQEVWFLHSLSQPEDETGDFWISGFANTSHNVNNRTFRNMRQKLFRVCVVRVMKLCILCYLKRDQRRFSSDCTNSQTDLRWVQMPKAGFLNVASHIVSVFTLNIKTPNLYHICLKFLTSIRLPVLVTSRNHA